MLSFFDSITGSYALALLFYALIFKIVFLPFSIKQQRNQIKLASLTPKIALIRAKYKSFLCLGSVGACPSLGCCARPGRWLLEAGLSISC